MSQYCTMAKPWCNVQPYTIRRHGALFFACRSNRWICRHRMNDSEIYGSVHASSDLSMPSSDDVNEPWKPALESIDDVSLDIIDRHLEMFQRADRDKNGVLDRDELRMVLESVGDGKEALDVPWLTDDDLETILSQYDDDNDGVIDEEEFRKLAQDNVFLTRALREYKAMFDALDTGKNGVIGPTELYQFFEKNKESMGRKNGGDEEEGSFEHVCGLISRYDLNNDGVISFPEFLRLCRYERALPLEDIVQYASTAPAVAADPLDDVTQSQQQQQQQEEEEYVSPYEAGMVHMITSKDEFTTALRCEKTRGRTVIVLFASLTWCRPCKKIQPQLEKIAKAYPDVLFFKLYGNESDQTKSFFKDDLKVRVTPSFFFFGDGELAGSCTGANPTTVETELRKLLQARGASIATPMLYP